MHALQSLICGLAFLILPPFVLASPLPRRRAATCNGHAELCSRSYGNVTFIGSHDSFAWSNDPALLSRDQEVDISTQLSLGVRLLQAQSHWWEGALHFCHTDCILYDGGTVQNYLTTVKGFLDQNPNEVLTLLFTNPESQPVATVWKPIFDQAGLTPYIYVPPHTPMKYDEWPTLGEMIDSGKRVVMFMDYGADTTQVDFILPEFDMIWETPYGITDPCFPCSINRISGPLSITDHMYMINHSLNRNVFGIVLSDPIDAQATNGVVSVLSNAYGCVPLGGNRNPNFLLLDFVNSGDAFHAAAILNGVALSSGGSSPPSTTRNGAAKLTAVKANTLVQISIPIFVTTLLLCL